MITHFISVSVSSQFDNRRNWKLHPSLHLHRLTVCLIVVLRLRACSSHLIQIDLIILLHIKLIKTSNYIFYTNIACKTYICDSIWVEEFSAIFVISVSISYRATVPIRMFCLTTYVSISWMHPQAISERECWVHHASIQSRGSFNFYKRRFYF